MASSKLNQTNLTFTDSSSNTGTLNFTSNKFDIDKPVLISNGVASTQLSVGSSGQVKDVSSVDTLDIDNLNFRGSTSGEIILQANPTTTIHTLTLPDSQGTAGSYLINDGSGELSWSDFNENHYGESGDRRYAGYIDIGETRIQYGMERCTTDNPQTVNLPASFSNTSYTIQLTMEPKDGAGPGDPSIGLPVRIRSMGTNTFEFDRDNDLDETTLIHWMAVGKV